MAHLCINCAIHWSTLWTFEYLNTQTPPTPINIEALHCSFVGEPLCLGWGPPSKRHAVTLKARSSLKNPGLLWKTQRKPQTLKQRSWNLRGMLHVTVSDGHFGDQILIGWNDNSFCIKYSSMLYHFKNPQALNPVANRQLIRRTWELLAASEPRSPEVCVASGIR